MTMAAAHAATIAESHRSPLASIDGIIAQAEDAKSPVGCVYSVASGCAGVFVD
jgi:hypothetical protein